MAKSAGGSYCSSCGQKHRGKCAASQGTPPPKETSDKERQAAERANKDLRDSRWTDR